MKPWIRYTGISLLILLLVVGQFALPSKGLFGKLYKQDYLAYPHPEGICEARVYHYDGKKLEMPVIEIAIVIENSDRKDLEYKNGVYLAYYRNEDYRLQWMNSDSLLIKHNSEYDPITVVDSTFLVDFKMIHIIVKKVDSG